MKYELQKLKYRKRIKLFNILNDRPPKKLSVICDNLVDGYIYLTEQAEEVRIDIDELWTSDPLNDRSWRFWAHCLIMSEHLINGFDKFSNVTYLDKALDFLWSWMKHNYPEADSEMAWHDHSTALRLISICKLFEVWRATRWDEELALRFIDFAKIHCLKLITPGFYKENHNHGLDQDIALFIAATVFDCIPEAADWGKLAVTRLWKQLEHLIAPDGSYLEHSPGYSYLFCDRLIKFMNFLKQQNSIEHTKLEELINGHLVFLTHITQPDGQVPPIGDGYPTPIMLKVFKCLSGKALDLLKYSATRGTEGAAPEELDKVFPHGGYAIMRNKWGYDRNTIQVVFYSSFHSRIHKHHDDLAVTLFGHGQPILVDASKFNYDYSSEGRQYVVSTRAHNTVTVDNADTETTRLNIGKSGLTGYYLSEDLSIVSGAHRLYKGVIHERMLIYLKPWDCLVIDRLKSKIEHKFDLIFNFDPSIECQLEDRKFKGYVENNIPFTISPLLKDQQLEPFLIKGEKKPLRGWCSLGYGKLTPTWSGIYELNGKVARFATQIDLLPSEKRLAHFEWNNDELKIVWKGTEITILFETIDNCSQISCKPIKVINKEMHNAYNVT